jgi:CubicO group peptidase (beta-lactamase class C family)
MQTENQPGPTLDPEALDRLDASIQADIDRDRILGASIIVARNGVIRHRKLFGTVGAGRPAREDDLYLLMSASKALTASLVLRAIDHQRFTLDTRVADILPAFAADGKHRVTIRQVLTHTAGVFAGLTLPPPYTRADMGDLKRYVDALCQLPLVHTPGERVLYSPLAGYAILGRILVETDCAKRSFQTIAREDLFEPLGMHDSSFGLPLDHPRRVRIAYTESSRTPISAGLADLLDNLFDERGDQPSGAAFATVSDVFRFAETLRRRGSNDQYRLMSQATFDYACQSHTGDLPNEALDGILEDEGLHPWPVNFSLLGGVVRGPGHHLSPAGYIASPGTFLAAGGGAPMWMVDPRRGLTFVFLSAGFIDGLAHHRRLQRLSDLVLAACVD